MTWASAHGQDLEAGWEREENCLTEARPAMVSTNYSGLCHAALWVQGPFSSVQFNSVTQSCPTLCDPWIAASQASLSITNSRSSLRLLLYRCLSLLMRSMVLKQVQCKLFMTWSQEVCALPSSKGFLTYFQVIELNFFFTFMYKTQAFAFKIWVPLEPINLFLGVYPKEIINDAHKKLIWQNYSKYGWSESLYTTLIFTQLTFLRHRENFVLL